MASKASSGDMPPSHAALVSGVQSLYTTREYADLTIKLGGHEFPVHKSIVCTQSKFFASACKPSWQKDPTNATVTLEDDEDPNMIEKMIDYFYLSDYDEGCTIDTPGPMELNVTICIAADKFDVKELSKWAIAKFAHRVDQFESEHDFCRAVHLLYTNASHLPDADELRKTVVKAAVLHAKKLLASDGSQDIRSDALTYKSLLVTCPDFATAVMAEFADKAEREMPAAKKVGLDCVSCGALFIEPQSIAHGSYWSMQFCPYCGTHGSVQGRDR